MAGHNSLELEIHGLFQAGNSLETICNEVLSKYEKSDIVSPLEVEGVSHFLLTAGRLDLLFKFYLKCLRKNSLAVFPWGFFLEAVALLKQQTDELIFDLAEMGLEAQPEEESCYKSPLLLQHLPQIQERVVQLHKNYELNKLQMKSQLMAQLNHNRLYQLVEQEEQTLNQLIKLFPSDIDVKLMHQAHLEKKADEILARIKSKPKNTNAKPRRLYSNQLPDGEEFIEKLKATTLKIANDLQSTSPEHIYNLALLAMYFELYELSLELLEKAPVTPAILWFKAEMLFEAGRNLELLNHLEYLENQPTRTAETTYGIIYLKAQAYFALGQKEIAIRLLESLSDKATNYRSTQALLHEWKTS